VLLNWRLPAAAATARTWVHEGADAVGRDAPLTALYVRVAVGPGSSRRLEDDERRYREIDPAHFAAMDAPVGSIGVAASQRSDALDALAPYRSVIDLPIVRVLAGRDAASLLAVADATAP
jgi:hypothetical protein